MGPGASWPTRARPRSSSSDFVRSAVVKRSLRAIHKRRLSYQTGVEGLVSPSSHPVKLEYSMYQTASYSSSTHSRIDLRSDTVTRPSPEMRRAMFEAEVGDDVYREDPTINRLERRAAEIFGREAALFVPSGTMGNQIAIKLHTTHGQEVICDTRSHVFNYELSMMAWFSGCLARPIAAEDGILRWDQ